MQAGQKQYYQKKLGVSGHSWFHPRKRKNAFLSQLSLKLKALGGRGMRRIGTIVALSLLPIFGTVFWLYSVQTVCDDKMFNTCKTNQIMLGQLGIQVEQLEVYIYFSSSVMIDVTSVLHILSHLRSPSLADII